MGRLTYAASARNDLLEIWLYIAFHDPNAADRVIDRIEAACARLRLYPKLGKSRPEIGDGARTLIVERWLAIYRLQPGGVQIVRIVDGSRDLRFSLGSEAIDTLEKPKTPPAR